VQDFLQKNGAEQDFNGRIALRVLQFARVAPRCNQQLQKDEVFLGIVATWATVQHSYHWFDVLHAPVLSAAKKKSALKGPTDLWMVPVVPSPVAIHSLVDAQFFKQPCVEQPAVQLLQSLMICRELASCVQCSLSEYSAECVTLPRSKRGLVLDEMQCVISIRP